MKQILQFDDILNYFQLEIFNFLNKNNLNVKHESSIYLASVLSKFCNSNNLFVKENKNLIIKPLVEHLIETLDQFDIFDRLKIYRKMGDQSLYMLSVHERYLRYKGISLEYYKNMGIGAYSNVSDMCRLKKDKTLYNNISNDFNMLIMIAKSIINN